MKKFVYIIAAMAAMAGAASCSSKTEKAAEETTAPETPEVIATAVYAGQLPAADVYAIDYAVALSYTGENEGTYAMEQVYLADSATVAEKFETAGTFTVGDKDGQKYLKLTGVAEEEAVAEEYYFIIDSDSTITMTGEDLVASESPLNYTLTLK